LAPVAAFTALTMASSVPPFAAAGLGGSAEELRPCLAYRAPATIHRVPGDGPKTTSRQRATSPGNSTLGRIAAMNARRPLRVDVARRLGFEPAFAFLQRHVMRDSRAATR
jgi:hypothetical protein